MDDKGDLQNKFEDPAARPNRAPALAEIRSQLSKVLSSQTFRSAEGQRAFLRFAGEETIAGRGELLKEYTIGTEAFGRGESFDPRLDPIVRTQARKLRARLSKYFETEGALDALRIEFPKGSYAPSFRAPAAPAPDVSSTMPAVSGPARESVAAPSDARFHLRWKMAVITLAILGLVGSGSAALYVLRPALGSARPSIAVMPFVNIGSGNSDEFLSDGLTGELIDSLSRVPGLQVVARTSSFRFKGKRIDVGRAGRELGVATVLEGSVLKSGNRLRVTVQLNNAADGYRLWSGNYERESKDAAEIEQEISQSIAGALAVRFATPSGQVSRRARPNRASPNPSAYRDYLKGRYVWNKLNLDSLRAATAYFEQAIGEDPSYAPAYTALADSYVMAPQVAAASPAEVLSKIRAAASKALELDPSLGEPHFDLAVAAEYEYDWRTAEGEFAKGLQLEPGSVVGHVWYAKLLGLEGRKDEVLVQRRIAAELDPVSPYALQAVGGYLSVVGRYDEAIAQFRNALALEPGFGLTHQGLGVAYILKGMSKEGIKELELAQKLMPGPRRLALLGYGYGYSGRTAEARQVLADLLRQSERHPLPALAIAQVYIGLGNKDRAFEWLEKAIDQRDLDVTLQWDSLYEPLRSDSRYLGLLRRMKLA
jgi:TolB-like protein/Tfp pilus assembly protein PilF